MEQSVPGRHSYQCKDCGRSFLNENKLQRHVLLEHTPRNTLIEYRCIPAEVPIDDGKRPKTNEGTLHEPPVRIHIKLNHVRLDKPLKKASRKRSGTVTIFKERKKRNRSVCRQCNLSFYSEVVFEQHLKRHVHKTDAVVRLMRLPFCLETSRNASEDRSASPGKSKTDAGSESLKPPCEMQESNGAMLRSMLVSDCDVRQRGTSIDGTSNALYLAPQRTSSVAASSEAAADSFDRSLMAELNSHIKSLAESIMKGPKEGSDGDSRILLDSRPTTVLQNASKSGSQIRGPAEESTLSAILKSPLSKPPGYPNDVFAAVPNKFSSLQPNGTRPTLTNGLPSTGVTISPSSSSAVTNTPVECRMRSESQSSEGGSRLCAILKSALVGSAPKTAPCLMPRPAPPPSTVGVTTGAFTERCNSVVIIENGPKTKSAENVPLPGPAGQVEPASEPSPLAMLSQLSSQTAVGHGALREATEAALARPASVIVLDSPAASDKHPGLSIQSVVSLAPDHAQELWGEAAGPHVLQDRRSQCCCGVCRNVRDGNLLPKSEIKMPNGRIEYYCPICRRRFTHKISLFRHCRSFGHAFVCDMCSCGFLDQATFEAHKKSIHLVTMCSPLNAAAPTPITQKPRQRCPPPLVSAPVSRPSPTFGAPVAGGNGGVVARRHRHPVTSHPSPGLVPTKSATVEDDDVIVVGVEPGRGRPSGTLPQPPPLKRRPLSGVSGPPVGSAVGQQALTGGFARKAVPPATRGQKLPFSSPGVTLQRISTGDSPDDVGNQPSQLARILRNSEITLTPIESRKPDAPTGGVSSPGAASRPAPVLAPTGANPLAPSGHRGVALHAPTMPTTNVRAALGARNRLVVQATQAAKAAMAVARGPAAAGSTMYRVHPVAPQLTRRPDAPSMSFQSLKDSSRAIPVWHHPVPSEPNRVVLSRTMAPSVAAPQGSSLFSPPPLTTTLPSCHQSQGPNKFPPTTTHQNDAVFVPPPPPYPRPATHQRSSPPAYRPPNPVPRVTWANPVQQSLGGTSQPSSSGPVVRCQSCETTFQTQFAMQAHFNLMHAGVQRQQEFSCGRCQRSYSKPALLKRHEMNCTEKVRCAKCNQLHYRNELLAHYSMDHYPGAQASPGPALDRIADTSTTSTQRLVGDGGETAVDDDASAIVVDDGAETMEMVTETNPLSPGLEILSCTESPQTNGNYEESLAYMDGTSIPLQETTAESADTHENDVAAVLLELVLKVDQEMGFGMATGDSSKTVGSDVLPDVNSESPADILEKSPGDVFSEPSPRVDPDDVENGDVASLSVRSSDVIVESEKSDVDDRFLRDSPESPEECGDVDGSPGSPPKDDDPVPEADPEAFPETGEMEDEDDFRGPEVAVVKHHNSEVDMVDEEVAQEDAEPSVEKRERICPICDQRFSSDRRFFRHLELHREVATRHHCTRCEATFRSRKLLMSHFRSHLRSCGEPPAKRRRSSRHDADHAQLVVALLDLKQVEANKEFLRRMGVVGLMTLENLRDFFSQKTSSSPRCAASNGFGTVPMINLEEEEEVELSSTSCLD